MSDTASYESRLWKLLEEQNLADLSQFHQRGFFDEVPLYSRKSDLDFLPRNASDANKILLRFALKFLKAVVAYEQHRAKYLAAITVWNTSNELLIPSLFVWCGDPRELEEKLELRPVRTPFGRQIKKLVPKPNSAEEFEVLEDTQTVPDSTRVFIALERPAYHGLMTLDHFRGPATASR